MKGVAIYLDTLSDGRRAAARMIDGRLDDILIDPPEDLGPALPEAIFLARMGRQMKGMGGAMVDLAPGLNGFLREAKGLSPGAGILVQVTTASEAGKAPPVTRRVLFKSRYAIVTPDRPGINVSRTIRDEELRGLLGELGQQGMEGANDEMGLIIRSAAAEAGDEEVADDITRMRSLAEHVLAEQDAPQCLVDAPDAHTLAWRDWAQPVPDLVDDQDSAFERGAVWEEISQAVLPQVPLTGGANMAIEPTRALVAVDVNTGPDTSLAAGLKANVAALRALPGALRLRGLGGQVIIDLAPFPKRERSQLEQVLKAALRADGSETNIAGWTPLGHVELQRKRDRRPLKELLSNVLPDL